MRNTIIFALAMLILGTGVSFARWEQIGPWGGDRHELLVDPSDSNRAYVGGAGGFIHVSTDNGYTWESRSTDLLQGALSVESIVAHTGRPGVVFAGTMIGIYFSTDYGDNWEWIGPDTAYVTDLEIDALDPGKLYAAFGHGEATPDSEFVGIRFTTDDGSSWNTAGDSLPPSRAIRLGQTSDGKLFASTLNNGLWRLDSGIWRRIGIGLPDSLTVVVPDPFDPALIVVGSAREWAFISTDTGETFIPLEWPGPDTGGYVPGVVTTVEFDPNVPGNLWITSFTATESPFYGSLNIENAWDIVALSTDYGATWAFSVHASAIRMEIDPHSPVITSYGIERSGRVFFCEGGTGVIRSDEGGLFPEASNEGIGAVYLNTISVFDGSVITGAEKGVDRTTDCGTTWVHYNVRLEDQPGYLYTWDIKQDPFDSDLLWVAKGEMSHWWQDNEGLYYYRLSDSSTTRDSSTIGIGIWKIVFHPNDPDTVYLATQAHGILRSTDGGETWSDYSIGLTELSVTDLEFSGFPPVAFCCTREDSGISWHNPLPGEHGGVYRLDGDIWTNILSVGSYACRRLLVDSSNPERIWVVAFNYGLWRTTDGGATWSDCNSGLPCTFARCIAADPLDPDVIYLGISPFGVYRSTNGGGSWTEFNDGLYCGVSDVITVDADERMIYLGTLGGSVFKRSLDDLTICSDAKIIPNDILISAYPNPFNSSCMITAPEGAEIEICDLNGKHIEAFDKTPRVWQPDKSIASGIYLVRATVGNHSVTKKLVLIK